MMMNVTTFSKTVIMINTQKNLVFYGSITKNNVRKKKRKK